MEASSNTVRRRVERTDALVVDAEVEASQQHGVLTTKHLDRLGVSRSIADQRVADGCWKHAAPSVYAVVAEDVAPLQDIAVLLACVGPRAFAHRLAGADAPAHGPDLAVAALLHRLLVAGPRRVRRVRRLRELLEQGQALQSGRAD